MLERKSSWIRGREYRVYLAGGSFVGYRWYISISIKAHSGKIKSGAAILRISNTDPQKTRLRSRDREFFIKHCGTDFMKDKEVDHNWNSEIVWCRVVSPEENGGRVRVQSGFRTSLIDTEEWIEEVYPGERR